MLIIKSQNRKEIVKESSLILDKKEIYAFTNGWMCLVATYDTEDRAKNIFRKMKTLIEKSVKERKTMIYKVPLK